MGQRTPLLFELAALPTDNIGVREAKWSELLATGDLAVVRAKVHNFYMRGFITNEDLRTMTLTAKGRSAKDSQ